MIIEIEEIQKELEKERNSYQANLREMRKDRLKGSLSAHKDLNRFAVRIGELSLAFAAAITPILILSDKNINQREYLVTGILVYLLIGLFTIYQAKKNIEFRANFYPQIGIDLEADVQKIIYNCNKLIWNPRDKKSINNFFDSKKEFVNNNFKVKEISDKINYGMDILIGGFITATYICLRSIWLFDPYYYWFFFGITIIVVLSLTLKSSLDARKQNEKYKEMQKVLDNESQTYIDWQSKILESLKQK